MSPQRIQKPTVDPAKESRSGLDVLGQIADITKRGATSPDTEIRLAENSTVDPSRKRTSNMLLDRDLTRRALQLASKLGLSHGQLLIKAIEAEYKHVKPYRDDNLIGGELFAPLSITPPKSGQGDAGSAVFTFRLRESDFAAIDRQVELLNFANRKTFVSACLEAYCDHNQVD